MRELNKRIEEFSEELYADLSPVPLPEEVKADIYARIEERLHQVIKEAAVSKISSSELEVVKNSLDHEDYGKLSDTLGRHAELTAEIQEKIEQELKNLKTLIQQEQKDAGQQTT